MAIKLSYFCSTVRRNLFLPTLTHLASNFSVLADSNVANSNNAPSQNLFLHFITTRFDISLADAAKMVKFCPTLCRLKSLDNIEETVFVLNKHGCSEDQIAKIIKYQPSLLLTSAERLLEPKIQLLKDHGIVGENLSNYVTGLPSVLGTKLELLRSNLELLRTVFPTPALLIRAIRSNPRILSKSLQETFKTSVAFWEDFGFRGTELTMFLLVNPWVLTRTCLSPEQLDLIRRIGIPKESNLYKYIVNMVAMNRIEDLEARIHNLQLWGLSPEEALEVVRAEPLLFKKLEANIKKKMDFMLNHMKLSVDFVVKRPRLLSMSLEKVIRPRFSVLQNMTAMNGEGQFNRTRIFTMLMMPEAKFVSQIIQGHPEAATLWTVYKNAIANVSDGYKI